MTSAFYSHQFDAAGLNPLIAISQSGKGYAWRAGDHYAVDNTWRWTKVLQLIAGVDLAAPTLD